MPLSNPQRRQLKGLAHHLKPVVMVGQHGLSDGVLNEVGIALDTHELIKVRISTGEREQRQEAISAICAHSGAETVQTIGHVAVFYLRHPKKPKIRLTET